MPITNKHYYQVKYLKYRNKYLYLTSLLAKSKIGGGKLETSLSSMSQDLFNIDSDRIGIYPTASDFKEHYAAWNDIIRNKYHCGIIATKNIKFPTDKLLRFLQTNKLELNQNLVLKFVCLERCNKQVKSFYLVTRPAVQTILQEIQPEIITSDDSDLDEIYKLFSNYKIVYWNNGEYTLTQSAGPEIIIKSHSKIDLGQTPIDIVYTWVNSNDLTWQRELNNYLSSEHFRLNKNIYNHEFLDKIRYRDRDELMYSLRSVEKYCPWVRHVFIVTNGQLPSWLNTNHPKIRLIRHSDIMPSDHIPTFNSLAIEANLHKIPELSDYFIYFNDDFFINTPLQKSDFIDKTGKLKIYLDTTPSMKRCNYLRNLMEQYNLLNFKDNISKYSEIEDFIENCYKLYKISPKGTPTNNELGHYSQWKNSNKILDQLFVGEERKFLSHNPYIQHRPTVELISKKLHQQLLDTSQSRFRSTKCIGTTNAIYPYYSYYNGDVTMLNSDQDSHTIYLHDNDILNEIQFKSLAKFSPKFFVIQDSQSKIRDSNKKKYKKFISSVFPTKSKFEK